MISNAHNFTLSAPLNVAPPGVGKIPPILTNEAFKINSFHWLITEQKRVLWVNSTHTGLIYYFYGQNTCMFTYAHLCTSLTHKLQLIITLKNKYNKNHQNFLKKNVIIFKN